MQNEDSTLFSLDELTKGGTPKGGPSTVTAPREEDSGLIDIGRLAGPNDSQRGFALAAPPPLGDLGVKPPLGAVREAPTLSGLTAPDARVPEPSRWRLPLFTGMVLVGAAAFAFCFRALLPEENPAPLPAQTIVVLAPAPSMANEEPRDGDRTGVAHANSAPTASAKASPPPPRHAAPRRETQPRPPNRARPEPPKPPNREQKPAKPKDPCAHCGGDLSCAMRCSVRGSG